MSVLFMPCNIAIAAGYRHPAIAPSQGADTKRPGIRAPALLLTSDRSVDDDLHAPVLRLPHARTGRHQQVRLAKALDADDVLRHAVTHQFGRHRLGAAYRQALVVARRAGGIGVAV